VGAVLAKGIPTQIAGAVFMLSMDLVLFLQWALLSPHKLPHGADTADRGSASCACCRFAAVMQAVMLAVTPRSAAASTPLPPPLPRCGPRFTPPWQGLRAGLGWSLGSISAIAYISGISLQVARTARRRSDVGLSRPTFALVCATNVTYALSVALRLNSGADVVAAAPWLLGSAVPAVLDATVLIQAHVYGARAAAQVPRVPHDLVHGRNGGEQVLQPPPVVNGTAGGANDARDDVELAVA